MLVSMKELLQPTRQHGFAIGAFNVADSCFVRAVVEEAEATNTPAMILSAMRFLATSVISPCVARFPLLCIWTTALRLSMSCGRFSVGLPR